MGSKKRKKPEEAPETHRVLMINDQISERRIGEPETLSEAIKTAKDWAQEMVGCDAMIEVVKIVGVAEIQSAVVYSGDGE